MNYYELLGVAQDADLSAIKAAFRKKAKKYHPDTNPGNKEAEKIFKELNEAYTILSDENKRIKYDYELRNGSGFTQNTNQTTGKAAGAKRSSAQKTANPFMGFGAKFDFDEMMGAGMKFEKDYSKTKKKVAPDAPDFLNTNMQFASFFGFKPH